MICIDQDTGEKNEEPYITLTKTRRVSGRILFGQHATHLPRLDQGISAVATIQVGDPVEVHEQENGASTTAHDDHLQEENGNVQWAVGIGQGDGIFQKVSSFIQRSLRG